jgi:hypothetical protein
MIARSTNAQQRMARQSKSEGISAHSNVLMLIKQASVQQTVDDHNSSRYAIVSRQTAAVQAPALLAQSSL